MTELDTSAPAESGATTESPPVSSTTDANPAPASSTEAPKGVETSLLDHVKSALGQQGAEKSPISESGEGKPSPEPAVSPPQKDELADEIKALSTKAQTRFRDLVGQRKAAEERATAVEAELKPKAEKLDTILSYMETNRIAPQEFDNALELTRIVKSGDWGKALEILRPIYLEIADKAGKILPVDLQERIRLGHINEADARQLHESRTRATNLEKQTAEERQRTTRQSAEQEAQRVVTTSVSAADNWAKAKASTDPDWHTKQDLVAEQVELEMTRRLNAGDPQWFPQTSEEVVKRSEEALKVVEKRLKSFAPRPQAKTFASGQPASPRSAAAPKTLLDAVKIGLARNGS